MTSPEKNLENTYLERSVQLATNYGLKDHFGLQYSRTDDKRTSSKFEVVNRSLLKTPEIQINDF